MTLSEILLQRLSNWQPAGTGRHVLAVTDEASGWTVLVDADRVDNTGCLVHELTLTRKTAGCAASDLRAWAERIAARTGRLPATLKVIEVDSHRNEALLRSQEPTLRGEHRLYYEVLVKGVDEVVLRRYQANLTPGQQRQLTAFALTHEVLAMLVGDWTSAS